MIRRVFVVSTVCALALAHAFAQIPTPSADGIIEKASEYVEHFVATFTNVVAEERYEQTVTRRNGGQGIRRSIRSDFLLVQPGGQGDWYQFRDVIEVDGERVGNRDTRLLDLFVRAPPADALERARQVWRESTRYNIGGLDRVVNLPLVTLGFLQNSDRRRFEHTLDKREAIAGTAVTIVTFRETARPTVIRGEGDADLPTHGRYWIEATGQVRRTELKFEGPSGLSTITTNFRREDGFDILVPAEMTEEHASPRTDRITARATYGRFRRFGVSTDETPR